jgi:hypothetical protein
LTSWTWRAWKPRLSWASATCGRCPARGAAEAGSPPHRRSLGCAAQRATPQAVRSRSRRPLRRASCDGRRACGGFLAGRASCPHLHDTAGCLRRRVADRTQARPSVHGRRPPAPPSTRAAEPRPARPRGRNQALARRLQPVRRARDNEPRAPSGPRWDSSAGRM